MAPVIVDTAAGTLRGTTSETAGGAHVARFLGIPYATADRFRAPRRAPAWDGVRDALELGPIAPQDAGAQFQRADLPQSEDCLSLNVWAPEPVGAGAARPVLVWIHGGAYRQGSGASPMYDGAALAARGDVVVVTLNYRLGALGFLAHPSLAGDDGLFGNWGLLDQIEALRWVRDHIGAFGGDAGNVTIFGESAGAGSVGLLVTSPLARGLFDKAIMQSGAALGMPMETAVEIADELAQRVGVADVTALRDAPLADVLRGQAAMVDPRLLRIFAPAIDGRVLPTRGIDALRDGAGHGIPMVIGTNVDEWKLWAPADPHSRDLDEDGLLRRVARSVGDEVRARDIIAGLRAVRTDRGELAEPNDLWFAFQSDHFFRAPSLAGADAQAAHEPSTYVYLFGWGSPAMKGWLGACHGLEIAFVFGNQGTAELAAFTGSGPDADRLAETMMDAWIAFARTGDPSTPALPWPRHDTGRRPTMVFDAESRVEDDPRSQERLLITGRTSD